MNEPIPSDVWQNPALHAIGRVLIERRFVGAWDELAWAILREIESSGLRIVASEPGDWRSHLSPEVRAQHEALDEYYRIQGDADLAAQEIGT